MGLGEYHASFYVNSQKVSAYLKSFDGEHDALALLCSKLAPGDTVYDVGANMGLHAVFFSQAVGAQGRVVAFEPENHYRERLTANITLNGLTNVQIITLALGDRSCTSKLLPLERGKASPRLAEVKPDTNGFTLFSQKVRVVEGDVLVGNYGLPLPRLVKIDVEGYEHAVIRGLTRTLTNPTCTMVCCEVHPKLLPEMLNTGDIVDLLKACGFTRFNFIERATEQHVLASKDGPEARSH